MGQIPEIMTVLEEEEKVNLVIKTLLFSLIQLIFKNSENSILQFSKFTGSNSFVFMNFNPALYLDNGEIVN